MSAETLKAALDAFGPGVIAIAVLVFLIMKRGTAQQAGRSEGFDAEAKLYLKENVVEPILKALKT